MSYRLERGCSSLPASSSFLSFFLSGYWHPSELAWEAYLCFYATHKQQRNADLTVEIAVITWTNTLNNDMKWFSFVFLQECVRLWSRDSCRKWELRSVMLLYHTDNIYRAVISFDQEQTTEITDEDGLIQRIVRKGKHTRLSLCMDI